MITEIRVAGFKRFRDHRFKISNLTILTGLNGSGKTSLIQAIILAYEASLGKRTVKLNGLYDLNLGTASDVRNWEASDKIDIGIVAADKHYDWQFSFSSDEALYLDIDRKPAQLPTVFSDPQRTLTYLSAERLGPRSLQVIAPVPPNELEVGSQGEFSAQVLEVLGDKPIEHEDRGHPRREENASPLLKYEVERWLAEIARPVEVDAERYQGSSVASLRFRPPGGDWVRAPNMGFGVSYALPIVLGGLLASQNGILIVENPEAHLHPAGQSKMGTFLCWLAGKGVQIIVETHSDHVLNGIRRAIGIERYLDKDSAIVHFFEEGEGGAPQCQELYFTDLGGISHWPRGFFDQFQIDVAALGRARRSS